MKIDRTVNSELNLTEKRTKVTESLSGQLRLSVAISEKDLPQDKEDQQDESEIFERNSKLKSKTFSRLFSDLSLHLRAIDETCSKYHHQQPLTTGSGAIEEQDLPPRPPKSRSHQTITSPEEFRSLSPPPPPPPLLLPSPRYSPDSHQLERSLRDNSILSPFTTPPATNRRQQDLSNQDLHRELFAESSLTETSLRQQSSQPSHSSFALDSPSSESSVEKRRFHTATHFLVPGGLSTHHPSLSPQSPTTEVEHQNK
jgi:hypothetical protein